MKTVIQRVKRAAVTIDGNEKRTIAQGLVIFVGFGIDDDILDLDKTIKKIAEMRIFSKDEKNFELSLKDIKGSLLIVSQFTLYGDCAKGHRPDFSKAMPFKPAKERYDDFVTKAKNLGLTVETGEFGADMLIEIENDGPVTILL
jgi:D-tyrosyl-tRNA(Tyr) deacylase